MEIPGAAALEKIKKMEPARFYVAHGEYEFLNKELATRVAEVVFPDAAERDAAIQRFDWEDGEKAVSAWAEAASTPSLFGGNQLLIVDNAHLPALNRREDAAPKAKDGEKYSNWDTYRRFERAVESPLDDVVTVFICHEEMRPVSATAKGGRRSDKFLQRAYALLNEHGIISGFPKMYDNNVADWAAARARAAGLRMSTETAEFFVSWAGSDMRHIANEIDKLATGLDQGAEITEKDIRELTTTSDDQFVYQIFDAALDGRGNEALRLLDLSLKGSAQPLFITATLGAVMRDMWQARSLIDRGYFKKLGDRYGRDRAIAAVASVSMADRIAVCGSEKSGLLSGNVYKVFLSIKRARLLPISTIEGIMQRLLDIDCRFKGIRRPLPGSEESVLQQLIADISFVAKKNKAAAAKTAQRPRY